ncbi:MAG TPA: hypothetical protein VG692_05620 [Gemmatimonadales bacterium]|nr:hypothetical protein [Gemmatimonadales bacterium]
MARPILAPAEEFRSTHLYRPPWRLSERDVGRHLEQTYGGGWNDQDDHLQGVRMARPVMVGLDRVGSTRPDFYNEARCVAVEVKNWPLDRIATLAGHLRIQMAQRRWSMPAGTTHWMFFDLRGQRVGSLRDLARFLDQTLTSNQIVAEEVWLFLDARAVRAL